MVVGEKLGSEFDTEARYEQIGRLKMELEWVKKAGLLG